LEDAPSETDDFQGGAHARLADALVKIMSVERGGRVIGLEGAWGSGKSTVVSLLSGVFKSGRITTKEVYVFIFDAWAHQGDPLRRTFLERLISELEANKWLRPDNAKSFRQRLRGQKTTINTKKNILTSAGKITSLTLLFFPIGATLFDHHFSARHHYYSLFGLFILLLPLMSVAIFGFNWTWLVRDYLTPLCLKKNPTSKFRDGFLRELNFFLQDQTLEEIEENVIRGEPTSVDFEGIFEEIARASIQDSQLLVIVLDNLDRVVTEEARGFLSTMQTFTSSTQSSKPERWTERIWVLIPYDLESLRKIWKSEAASGSSNGAGLVTSDFKIENSFLEKIFEIRFTLPPLVLSDWRRYLQMLLKEAFPSLSDLENRYLVQLRSLYAGNTGGAVSKEEPTPRQLVNFVNQIGALMRTRNDIPILHVAYFVLLARDGRDIRSELLNGTFLEKSLSGLLSSTVQTDLCALFFGSDQKHALQLLLKRPIENALNQGEAKDLADLRSQSGFVDALESIGFDEWGFNGGVQFTHALATLNDAGLIKDSLLADWISPYLVKSIKDVTSWRLADFRSGQGLAVGVSLMLTPAECEAMYTKIAGIPSDPLQLVNEMTALAAFGQTLQALDIRFDSAHLGINLDAVQTIKALSLFGLHANDNSQKLIHLQWSAEQLSDALVEFASTTTEENLWTESAIRYTLDERVARSDLMTRIREKLQNQDFPIIPTKAFAVMLDILAESSDGDSTILELANSGVLLAHAGNGIASQHMEIGARFSMLTLKVRKSVDGFSRVRNIGIAVDTTVAAGIDPDSNSEFFQEQMNWLLRHMNIAGDLALGCVVANPNWKLWGKRTFARLHKEDSFNVSPDFFIANHKLLGELIGTNEFLDFTTNVLLDSDKRQGYLESSSDFAYVRCLLELPMVEATAIDAVTSWAIIRVGTASESEWLAGLQANLGGDLVHVALMLSKIDNSMLAPALGDALLKYGIAILNGFASGWFPNPDDLMLLIGLIDFQARENIIGHLFVEMANRANSFSFQFLQTFGTFISGHSTFRQNVRMASLMSQLISNQRWAEFGWFVSLAEQYPDVLLSMSKSDRDALLEQSTNAKLSFPNQDIPTSPLSVLEKLLS